MAFEYEDKRAKPKRNILLNLALAICFTGLFLMIVGAVIVAAFVALGGVPIISNLSYLLAVVFYLGLVVIALTAAAYSFAPPKPDRRLLMRLKPVDNFIRARRR